MLIPDPRQIYDNDGGKTVFYGDFVDYFGSSFTNIPTDIDGNCIKTTCLAGKREIKVDPVFWKSYPVLLRFKFDFLFWSSRIAQDLALYRRENKHSKAICNF